MNKIISTIMRLAGKNEVYIVGGWLRDRLLKKQNRDLDLVILKNPESFARKISRVLKGSFVKLNESNKIYRIVLRNNAHLDYIDVSKFKGKTINEDLKKRDFTVDALAVSVNNADKTSCIIGQPTSLSDIKNKTIRMTGPEVFKDDPLRLLRAFRLASELEFKIEDKTVRLIKKESKLISRVAFERVRDELFKTLSGNDSRKWIKEMDKAGLLDNIFPEIVRMKKSAKKFYYHPLGLWQHALETLEGIEEILSNLHKLFPESAGKLSAHLDQPLSSGITRRSLLKLVCLLHDMAKPFCAKREGKKMRFLGHESFGAKMMTAILKRLRSGKKEIKFSKVLIEHHMRPISLGQSPVLTDRAVYRLFRDIEDNVPDLMLLTLADCYSYRRLKTKKLVELSRQKKMVKKLIGKYFKEKENKAQPKIIDGHVIMKELKLEPGPLIGKLLSIIKEAQALGKVVSKEDALNLAKTRLTRRTKRNTI